MRHRNKSVITSAIQSCDALHSNVEIQQELTATSHARAQSARQHVHATHSEVTIMMANISRIRQLNPTQIELLRIRVRATQSQLNDADIISVSKKLQQVVDIQQIRINQMNAQKDSLTAKIQRINTIKSHLSHHDH